MNIYVCVGILCLTMFILFSVYWDVTPNILSKDIEGLTINEHNGLMFAINSIETYDPSYELFNTFDVDISGYYNEKYKISENQLPDNKQFIGTGSESSLASYEKMIVDINYTSDAEFNLISSDLNTSDLGKFFKKTQYLANNTPIDSNFTLPVGSSIKVDPELRARIASNILDCANAIIPHIESAKNLVNINSTSCSYYINLLYLTKAIEIIKENVTSGIIIINAKLLPIQTDIGDSMLIPNYSNNPNIILRINNLNRIVSEYSIQLEYIRKTKDDSIAEIDDMKTLITTTASNYENNASIIRTRIQTFIQSIDNLDNHLIQIEKQYTVDKINHDIVDLIDTIRGSIIVTSKESIYLGDKSISTINSCITSANSMINSFDVRS